MHIDANLTATTAERYSFEGNLLERIAPNGTRYNYTYENGRLMSERRGNQSTASYEYDAWGNVTRTLSSFDRTAQAETLFTYDKAGNLTSERVRNNLAGEADSFRRTDFTYDAWGRNTAIIYFGNGVEESRVSFVYDHADRVLEQQKANSIVSFKYDHMGNIVQKTDAMGQTETFAYDVAGRPVQSVDRNGTVHIIVYDLIGNPITKTNTNGTETITKTSTYDALGNLLTVNDGTEIIAYTYDGRGNRLTETRGNVTHIYTYNNTGSLLTSQILIGGQVQQNLRYEYNESGRIARVFEDNWLVTSYEYDALGRQIRAQNGNGIMQTTRYNAAGLVTSVRNTFGRLTISEYNYTYYLDGNQRTKTEAAGTTTYFYDGLNRLEKAILHDGTVQNYEFDSNGNRTKMTVISDSETTITTYTYDANDRITSQNENGVITLYTYDFNGNILSKSGGTVTVIQTFDLLNRMKTWTDGVSSSVYDYNPDNMRRSKTVNGVTTEHVWLGSNIALDRTGGDVVSYVHNIKSDYGWHIFNAHGDVVQLADDWGIVVRIYDYDPYGNQLIDNSDCLNPYRYNGQYYDFESGYIYLRHRYYDTSLGRFISEDPIFDGWNWYVYGNNNPLMYDDPTGLWGRKVQETFKLLGELIISSGASASVGGLTSTKSGADSISSDLTYSSPLDYGHRTRSSTTTTTSNVAEAMGVLTVKVGARDKKIAIAKAEQRVEDSLYYTAISTPLLGGADVYMRKPISFEDAIFRITWGHDVYAKTEKGAMRLCMPNPIGPEQHKTTDALHFHRIQRDGAHVFFGEDSNLRFIYTF